MFLNSSCVVFKTKAERADDVKARLILEKLEEDDAKTKAQQQMFAYVKRHEECQEEFTQSLNAVQVQSSLEHLQAVGNKLDENNKEITFFPTQNEILKLGKRRRDLLDKLKRCQVELEAKRAESSKLKQKFKVGMKEVLQLSSSPNYSPHFK